MDARTAELIWNSRDAAAPATVLLRDGRTAQRVKVHEPCLPNHIPLVGHTVLIDCTVEWAEQRAEQLAGQMWRKGLREGCVDRDELEARIYNLFAVDVEARYGIAVEVTPELAALHDWRMPA